MARGPVLRRALAAHLRARAFHNIAVPGGYFALAIAAAVLAIAH